MALYFASLFVDGNANLKGILKFPLSREIGINPAPNPLYVEDPYCPSMWFWL